jgi:hypothetical protein
VNLLEKCLAARRTIAVREHIVIPLQMFLGNQGLQISPAVPLSIAAGLLITGSPADGTDDHHFLAE